MIFQRNINPLFYSIIETIRIESNTACVNNLKSQKWQTADLTHYWHIHTFGAELCRRKLGVFGWCVCLCVRLPVFISWILNLTDGRHEKPNARQRDEKRDGETTDGDVCDVTPRILDTFFFVLKRRRGRRWTKPWNENWTTSGRFHFSQDFKIISRIRNEYLFSRQKQVVHVSLENPTQTTRERISPGGPNISHIVV